jgi:tetratricopeptide (TPR) repeat protein
MKKAISLIVFCSCLLTAGFSQQTNDLRDVFLAAESYYLFEEYDEALPLYLRLHRTFPDNYNLYFKIGVCYLNNAYEKDKSIFYLEKASENINPKYKDSNYKEPGAPLDALFFLGNAYRINNELDKARDSYNKFRSRMDSEIFNDKLVIEQLAACDVAESLMKNPVDLDVEILSNQVNTRFADVNPAVSGDETKMVFISKLQFYDAVFYTEKINGVWARPRNINSELGVDADAYPTCLSYDGTLLIIYRNDDFTGNLYSSSLVNGLWTPLLKLNENINTKYWESHASLTKDGNTLYFTSNRKGGFGGLDIYRSSKLSSGDWGPPVNLGESVNTSYNEETPFITENGRKLFFSSYGHYNMGGYDVFMSIMQSDSSWSKPENVGYPVNSTDDDIFFCPVRDGEIAYYPVYRETGYGKHDIYRYQVYTADFPRKYPINGTLNFSDEMVNSSEMSIRVLSKSSGDTVAITHPDEQGNFAFSLPAGKYSLVFDSKRFKQEIKSLEISQSTPHTGIKMGEPIKPVPLVAKLSEEDRKQKLQIEDIILKLTNNKPVVIEYEAEKGSVVIIRQYADSVPVKLDTIRIDNRRQSYEFIPQPGLNRLEFILTDKAGNTITKTISAPCLKDSVLSQALPREQLNKNNTGYSGGRQNRKSTI